MGRRFVVREVDGKAERALLFRLQREALPFDAPISSNTGWWWIAYEGDKPVAFASMDESVRWSDCVYLSRCGVLQAESASASNAPEAARGHGLQTRLIRARLRKARSLGMCWAITDTYENPESGNSLIRCGFRLYQPTRPWGADGVNYWRRGL